MTWISKSLTLDLLAIGIDCLQRTFDRIQAEPDTTAGQWPPVEAPAAEATEPTLETTSQPVPQPVPEPEPESAAAQADLHAEAQTILRKISVTEGADWIINVLFSKYGVQTLDAVPAGQMAALIADAKAHADETAVAA